VDATRIDEGERNRLLQGAADDVARRVLRNSYWQSLAVSLDERRVIERPQEFRDALTALEKEGMLDRGLEFLPGSETIAERVNGNQPPLVRPELSVLLAYAKLHLKRALLGSGVGEGPGLSGLLHDYFPEEILEAAGEDLLAGHRLAEHIAVTLLTNLIVDLHGGTGILQLLHDTQRDPADVAKAWYVAWRTIDTDGMLTSILALDGSVPADVEAEWLIRASAAIDRATRWLLANEDLDRNLEELVDWYGEPISVLAGTLLDQLSTRKRSDVERRIAGFTGEGMTEELARRFVALEYLDGLMPVARLARDTGIGASTVGRLYFGLAGELDFPWLQERLADLPGADRWQLRAARKLALDLEAARRRIVRHLLAGMRPEDEPSETLSAFRSSCATELQRVERILEELREEMPEPGLPGLMVVVNAIQQQCDAWSAD
jgi:glutamate dehydrogenase